MPFQKGHTPWNKGKKHKPETIEKLKKILKGRKPSYGFLGKNHSEETRAKMSKTRKGRPLTWRTPNMGYQPGHPGVNTGRTWFKPGANHPDYIDGRADQFHRTAEYRRWRRAVIKRDKICQHCGADKRLEAHHKNGRKNVVENGICLCKKCHIKVHKTTLSGAKGTPLERAETTGEVQSS